MSNPTTPPAGDRQNVPTDQAAPERIWAVHHEIFGSIMIGEWADTVRHLGGTEYVRADLADMSECVTFFAGYDAGEADGRAVGKVPELLPCPFCGGEGEIHSIDNRPSGFCQNDIDHWISCNGNDCLASVGMAATREEALAAWNRRADLASPSAQPVARCVVPVEQTPLDEKLNHRFLDVIKEGETARDAGTGSPYHGHSLEHCLHAAGWVSRDLQLALDETRSRAAPSAPAAVEGLVAALIKADRGHDPGTLFTEAATALTAQQAENARLTVELEAALKEQDRLAKAWDAKHAYQVEQSKSHKEYFEKSQKRMHELASELTETREREALERRKVQGLMERLTEARVEALAAYERAAGLIECDGDAMGGKNGAAKAIRALATEPGTTAFAEIVKKAVDAEMRACAIELEINWGHIATPEMRDAILARIDQRKEAGK